ncbi:MAG: hypothetical protein QOF98_3158 [Streptomyces sp.]|nr:hypothetical protein [Streptomyces sp.]
MALEHAGTPESTGTSTDTRTARDTDTPAPGRGELLPCGASLALLWEEGGPPEHRRCPHCAGALDELTALDRTVRAAVALAADELPARDLTARVMDLVRAELRPSPLVPLDEPEGWITELAAARLLRRAAESLPGVAAGSCRIVPLAGARTHWGGRLPREPLRVRLEIALHPDLTVPEASTAVRSRVLLAAADHIGLDLAAVDIAVVDLLDPDVPGQDVPSEAVPGQAVRGGAGRESRR